ncbi:hypothetical protein [Pseudomonas fluorescens]|uniref:hypothetical protein n=1 Tax=Pseudomonas fluorescens TaxID=294 RepID=UPI0005EB1014|nr:hypothetical protein [Pseudomonas fluorescens]
MSDSLAFKAQQLEAWQTIFASTLSGMATNSSALQAKHLVESAVLIADLALEEWKKKYRDLK